jgi:hypothetical protein
MGVVAGVPEGHRAEEAGQTPQATAETKPEAEQQQPEAEQIPEAPGFGERGRMRRRARFLRKARELAYRDLGGLVFDLHRFGQRNDPLVLAKLATLRQIDTEQRDLEGALGERRPVTVLREVGIAACPRCAAIHGSDDRFCPGCGLAFDKSADRPISSAPVSPQPAAPPVSPQVQPATPPKAQPAAPLKAQPGTPLKAQPATPPKAQPATPPKAEPPPPPKPVAAPVAAKPAVTELKKDREDEPTEILRPPSRGA